MPNFTYTKQIPDGPHNPSADQPLMKVNTNSTNDIIDVDHYTFNNSNGGLHKQSTYVAQTVPTTASPQLALYSKTGPQGTELYSVRDGVGATETLLIPARSSVVGPSRTTNGYTFLPGPGTGVNTGGILIQWGFYATLTSGSNVLTFAGLGGVAFASVVAFTPNIQVTGFSAVIPGNIGLTISAVSNTGFTVVNSNPLVTGIYWQAIGPI